MLDLVEQLRAEVGERFQIAVGARFGGDGDQTIVPLGFALLGLLGLDDAEQPRPDQTSAERRLVHEDKHVQGITIAAPGIRNKPEVIGKNGACRQDTAQFEEQAFLVPGEFVPASLGGVDDDVEIA